MFEREIQFIYDFNQNKVNKLGSFVTYNQLQNTDIHPAILRYISGEIEFLIFEDRQKLLKDSVFDYSGDTINSYFSQISDEIKRTKRFSLNYIEKLILHAASFTMNFLTRPNWSLLKFVFDEEKNKSSNEIKQIFNYLYYYPYLKKIVVSYLDKKRVVSISYDEFKSLLNKIDKIGLESNYHNIIEEAIDSMGEFFNVGVSKRRLIPTKAIHIFLEEKSLQPFIEKLEMVFPNPEVGRYDADEFKNILREVVFESNETVESPQADLDYAHDDDESTDYGNLDTFGQSHTSNIQKTEPDKAEMDEPKQPLREEDIPEEIAQPNEEGLEEFSAAPFSGIDDEELDEIDIDEDATANIESVEELAEYVKEEKELGKIQKEAETLISENEGDAFDENEEDIRSDFLEIEEPDASHEAEDDNITYKEAETEESKKEDVFENIDQKIFAETEITLDDLLGDEDITDSLLLEDQNGEPEELNEQEDESLDLGALLGDDEMPDSAGEMETGNFKKVNENNFHLFEEAEKDLELFSEKDHVTGSDSEEISAHKTKPDKEIPEDIDASGNEMPQDNKSILIDLTDLLENKKMNKIIASIFDYDMEDFATAIEKITEAANKTEAMKIVENICTSAQVSPTSKEAKTFKAIISEYFDRD